MKTQVASEGEHVIMWVQLAGVSNLSLRFVSITLIDVEKDHISALKGTVHT